MPKESFTEEMVFRARRFQHLAALRILVVAAYLASEALGPGGGRLWAALTAGGLFGVFAVLVFLFRNHPKVRTSSLPIQLVDLSATVLLALVATAGEAGVPLLMFYFLFAEAALLHGAREVLALTAISVVFYSAWRAGGEGGQFAFSFSSFMFMLVVGGALAWYSTLQRQSVEGRIASALRGAGGRGEDEIVLSVEEVLRELSLWLKCSRAVLGFWEAGADYFAICQYPPRRGPSDPPPVSFDHRYEWACLAGTRVNFFANDISLTDESGAKVSYDFDLHPYLIQNFEIYNVVGCGLYDGEKLIGRLLLINHVGEVRAAQLKKLRETAPLFAELVRQQLALRRSEFDSAERERARIAHDMHDGPLQSVISFEMRLEIIRKLRERQPEAAEEEFEALNELSHKLVSEMRTFVHRMRPIEADETSLTASARRLIEGFQKETGVAVTVVGMDNGELALPGKTGGEVLKVAREALHNIYKHAQATHVFFALEKKNNELLLSVDDNGQGFRFGGKYNLDELDALRIGPRSIKQRVRSLGGELTLESTPGHGSSLRVAIPLDDL